MSTKMKWLIPAALLVLIVSCSRREAASPPAASTTVAAAPMHKPLPDAAFKVSWGTVTMPAVVKAGSSTPVTLMLTNASTETWPDSIMADPSEKDGRYAVRVSYRWNAGKGEPQHSGVRAEIPHRVKPGETITIPVTVQAPGQPGHYSLEFELLQELVVWFEDKGVAPLKVPVEVQ